VKGGNLISSATFTLSAAGEEGFDNGDILAPPGDFESARVVLRNNQYNLPNKELLRDCRKPGPEITAACLDITNRTGEALTLQFAGNFIGGGESVYLFDKRLQKFYNLKAQNTLAISGQQKNHSFILYIGSQHHIDSLQQAQLPNEYRLFQNYPNPFNPVTTISFALPAATSLELKVFDYLGKEVATLVSGSHSAGYHYYELNAEALSSGVYFYRLSTPQFSAIKKLVLMK
jgi:hypothetical protein